MCKTDKKVVCEAQIVTNVAIAPGTYSLMLDAPAVAECVQPGQFVELNLRQPDLVLPRPISIYRAADGVIELLYQVMGEGTRRLSQMREGDVLGVIGSLGNGWPLPKIGSSNRWSIDEGVEHALLVAGGIGSAPLALLAQELKTSGKKITMVQAARNEELLIAVDFFASLVDEHIIATDDGSRGHEGLITEPLKQLLERSGNDFDVVYICGPEIMQEVCAKLTLAAGVTTYVSLERLMACGIGACLSCVVPTVNGLKRVCVDGPVFNAAEVKWDDAKDSRVH